MILLNTISKKLLKILPKPIRAKFSSSSERSKEAVRNIALTMVMKCINIFCDFLVVPMTISYLNPTQYGVWLALASVIGWIHFFNLGLSNGFRNKYAEAKARGDMVLARQYLSTTYISLGIIVSFILIIIQIGNQFVDWSSILNIESTYREELRLIFSIICTFVCLNMVLDIAGTMLTADQKPGLASMIGSFGRVCSLIGIYVLTKVSTGTLTNLATYYSGIPSIIMIISTIIIFNTKRYKVVTPSFKCFRKSLVKDLIGLGLRFFAIYLCLILIFQLINVAISREAGPLEVTRYNISHKYFSLINMIIVMIITPIWSAVTDAYTKKDFNWVRNIAKHLEKIWILGFLGGILMIIISPLVYKIWIGDSVEIPLELSICVFVLIMCKTLGAIYMYIINGIGTVRIQTIIYLIFAFICFPTFSYICRHYGLNYAILVPAFVYLVQAFFARKQIHKLLDGKAIGIWSK